MIPAADEELGSVAAGLRDDWGLNHLLGALSLAEGFELHILVCDTPKLARAVSRILEENAPGRVVHLQPQRSLRFSLEAFRFIDVPSLLEALRNPGQTSGEWPRITVLDASDASRKDERVWREIFRRMNERRNVMARELAGPLVLVLPPRLEVAFAHEAPDFWSIRSTSITVAPLAAAAMPLASFSRGNEPFSQAERPPWSAQEGDRLKAAVEAARQRVMANPDEPASLEALVVQLQRLGRFDDERGSLSLAEAAYREALEIQRRLVESDAERTDRLNDMAGLLVDFGDVQGSRGSLEAALSSYEESLGLMRRLLERDPDRPEWLRDLSVSLIKVGDVQGSRGSLEAALSSYEESLGLMRHLVERDPDRPQWLRDLVVSLDRVASIVAREGRSGDASLLLEEALETTRSLQQRFPEWSVQDRNLYTYIEERISSLRSSLKTEVHTSS